MPELTKQNFAVSVASIFTVALLMKMRRSKKTKKQKAAAASLSERCAFPIVLKKEMKETLGLTLGDVITLPPRISAASILGMPEDASNPVLTACIVLDAVTTVAGAQANKAADLFALAASSSDDSALLESVKQYIATSCPFLQGLTDEERSAIVCKRVAGKPVAVSTVVAAPVADAKANKKDAAAATNSNAIDITFGFEVSGKDTSIFVSLVPSALAIISLVVVSREGLTAEDTKMGCDAHISAALQTAFELSRATVSRLEEDALSKTTPTVIVANTHKDDATSAAATHKDHVVIANESMQFRAVLPSSECEVEDVRNPSALVPGTKEVFITVKGVAALGANTVNYARVTYYPTMPSTWEDDKAITDGTEKEDEFKRAVMRHFLGFVSNAVVLHAIDISGRGCLWFGESVDGTCCRTYVCPNFSIRGEKAKSNKKGGNTAKGMTVVRWEGPASTWEQSQKVLNSFLDYFQLQ